MCGRIDFACPSVRASDIDVNHPLSGEVAKHTHTEGEMKQLLKIAAAPAAADVRVGLGCDGDTGRREPGRVLPRGIRFGRNTSLQLRDNGAMSGGGLRTQRRLCARSVPAQQQQRLCLSAKAPACEERQASSCESIGFYFPRNDFGSVAWHCKSRQEADQSHRLKKREANHGK